MSKKTRTNIDLIQTASSIVDAMFPAGVAGKGPGAGSTPGGGSSLKQKGLKALKGKVGKVAIRSGHPKGKRKQGGGGKAGVRSSARATR